MSTSITSRSLCMNKQRRRMVAAALFGAALVLSQAAWRHFGMADTLEQAGQHPDVLMAYVDPGVAGFIIVSVLGFISAVGYTARAYIGRLKRLVRGGQNTHPDESGEDGDRRPER